MELYTGLNKLLDTVRSIFISMRPKQWIKNGFIFAGLVFSKSFFDLSLVLKTVYAFVLFSMVSGCVYIINDLMDKKADALHPRKSKRPIASGRLKTGAAVAACIIILVPSLFAAFLIEPKFFGILAGYLILVLAYSLGLKNVVILDVIIIAAGFVLRTIGGAAAINVLISPWLIACTTFLALFLALNKRKSELAVLSDDAPSHRANLKHYTKELIDSMLSVVTSTTIMSYALYTFTAGKSYYMMFTIPFVLYGIFRYQLLASQSYRGESPEILILKDKPLLINILLWVAVSIFIVAYFY
jgi:4-hydroxybenzoate polyprenyltransferase